MAYEILYSTELSEEVRLAFKELNDLLVEKLPAGREKALALTNLEQAWHWADAVAADDEEYF
ncbi:hypothetical protein FGG51_gp056 [Mycobacterium phage Astro]|uniref:Acb2/Tad1 hairpin domain-containing protein n=3 Tax=Fromanvirus TaxID=186764 RepID=G8IRC8_9CAUD|nr:hypothetical protein AVT31_gp056 [Mycobacterium phage Smeadley]YP_009638310.1 hypothetical protein FGG39_gp57 [Mycobacterium phage Saintus]YP_009638508.1 hypothetical protein FGG51_gp056 [Mycobacterium phage Astro]AXQ63556.1 hypothetical protein SEA_DIXON_50 [Mycobacterium phage Dixon]QBI96645.1 hypothetical protein SEA_EXPELLIARMUS_50 [Mycobacterium phage Expelliarmus]QHB36943.1 hypothetical protein SEA_ROARY_51 [Mycobacterium phage Roary]AER26429.1 hypothetical protein SAINTUS_45 [Mycoba